MSFMVVMAEPRHDRIDELIGVFGAFLREVEVDHGGFELTVAHVALDYSWVDACLEKVCGVAVSEGVDGDAPFFDAGRELGFSEGPLGAVEGHVCEGCGAFIAAAPPGGEDPDGVSVGYPVPAEQLQCLMGKGDVAVLGTLAAVDVDHHPVAVDVGDLDVEGLGDSEPAGVDGGEEDGVVECCNVVEDAEHLFFAQDTGEPLFPFCAEIGKDVPVALEDVDEEEFDTGVGDAQCGRGPFVDISPMEKIVLEFPLADPVGGLSAGIDQHAHSAGIAFLGTFTHSGELQGPHGLIEVLCHGFSPFFEGFSVKQTDFWRDTTERGESLQLARNDLKKEAGP